MRTSRPNKRHLSKEVSNMENAADIPVETKQTSEKHYEAPQLYFYKILAYRKLAESYPKVKCLKMRYTRY